MSWWNWIKEAIFPVRCILCKREGKWLCHKHDNFVKAPKNEASYQHLDEIFAATAYYNEASKKTVEYFKFRGFAELADIMAEQMAPLISIQKREQYTIIPIPLHWTRKMWRGFNQAGKLAIALQKQLPHTKISLDLRRVQRTQQQSKLKRKDRLSNVTHAFQWQGEQAPKQVLLVDDVVASGSTMDAAAAELKRAGVQNVVGVVFARGGKPCENLHNET